MLSRLLNIFASSHLERSRTNASNDFVFSGCSIGSVVFESAFGASALSFACTLRSPMRLLGVFLLSVNPPQRRFRSNSRAQRLAFRTFRCGKQVALLPQRFLELLVAVPCRNRRWNGIRRCIRCNFQAVCAVYLLQSNLSLR